MSGLWWRFWMAFGRLFDEYKAARRLALMWACWLISVVVLRVTEPEIVTKLNTTSGLVVTAVIGILTTVVGFYMKSRERDDLNTKDRSGSDSSRTIGR